MIDDSIGLEGIISLNSDTVYKNWTKVIFGYCDGAMHQGSNANPISYKDTKLYFRGNNIGRAHFKWLISNHQLDQASKIMLSGSSAGGIAAFNWGNYLLTLVKNPEIVYIVPDSSIFINSTTFKDNTPLIQQQISTLMTIAHAT